MVALTIVNLRDIGVSYSLVLGDAANGHTGTVGLGKGDALLALGART
jgi:hypothetical protein